MKIDYDKLREQILAMYKAYKAICDSIEKISFVYDFSSRRINVMLDSNFFHML